MDETGSRPLTLAEVEERRRAVGPNVISRPRPHHFRRVASKFFHFFAVMLWVAAALATAVGLVVLGVAIVVVIVINAVFALVQEWRAERAATRLDALLPTEVTVRREGTTMRVDASMIVPDDILVITGGDRICADGLVVRDDRCAIDTSMLTGEDVPTTVGIGDPVYAGTFAVSGAADVRVTATGDRTRLAEISALASRGTGRDTPLTIELHRLVRIIAVIAVGVGVIFWVVISVLGRPVDEGVVFAIGVTVALVPEALLPTVTLSLAWGAERLAHRGVLVRRLEAVETLGSTTYICTDKTGTLTLNRMSLDEVWTAATGWVSVGDGGSEPVSDGIADVVAVALGCSSGHVVTTDVGSIAGRAGVGDPMEVAIDRRARAWGIDHPDRSGAGPVIAEFGFDPSWRSSCTVRTQTVAVKGAVDEVLDRCVAGDVAAARPAMEEMASAGRRILAVARRDVDFPTVPDRAAAESSLTLVGLIAFHDPPRADAASAIADCRRAGVRVAMLTGDHPVTARAIAAEVGLLTDHSVVVAASDLPGDDDELAALLAPGDAVVARVSPEDKLRIAGALQRAGHVVAMTGDGVNDAPALHQADIGVAMGLSGTDVAREVADLVLLDDRFESIVAGIEQGRATYLNIRRFLTYHLTDNVAELLPLVVWALSAGNVPLALGILQILALDIGTDTFSAVALGAEPPSRRVLDGPPVSGRLLDRTVARRAFGVLGPTVALWSMLAFVLVAGLSGWRPTDEIDDQVLWTASGATFLAIVTAQSANAFACRSSTRSAFAIGWRGNPYLLIAVPIGLGIALAFLVIPPVARLLGQAPPSILGWVLAIAAVPLLLVVDALDKRHRHPRDGADRRSQSSQTVLTRWRRRRVTIDSARMTG